jgi:hypothetical protein
MYQLIYPDTASGALWFVGPDSYPRRHPLTDAYALKQKKERSISLAPHDTFMNTHTRGLDLIVDYVHKGGKEPDIRQYTYLAPSIHPMPGVVLNDEDKRALGVFYRIIAREHPLLLTDTAIHWLDCLTGKTHMSVEVPDPRWNIPYPDVTHEQSGTAAPNSHVFQMGVVNGHPLTLQLYMDAQLVQSNANLKAYLHEPYSFTGKRRGAQVGLIVH